MIFRLLISTIALSAFLFASSTVADPSKMAFWNKQCRGANQQNAQHRPEWYVAARELGLDYVRILPDAWPADLNQFNREMVKAIRSVDAHTPIILDGWFYASPQAFDYNRPVDDNRVLYAFHNPGPWQMVTYRVNQGRYAYPDRVPKWWNGPTESWTIDRLAREMQAVQKFSERYNIPAHRIIASEFWYDRRLKGAAAYMADLIEIFNQRNWHWSFYAFRGDGEWTGLDYEIAPDEKMWRYWQAIEQGKDPESLKSRGPNPLWEILQRQFEKK